MRYLKKYNEGIENLDPHFCSAKIKENYKKSDIEKMLQNEVLKWVGDHHEYMNYSNGEDEEMVIEEIINWFKNKYKKDLIKEDKNKLIKIIQKEFPLLCYSE